MSLGWPDRLKLEDAARGARRRAFEIDDRGSQNPAYTLSVLVGSRFAPAPGPGHALVFPYESARIAWFVFNRTGTFFSLDTQRQATLLPQQSQQKTESTCAHGAREPVR
jgi:hypothetical protein